jgi:hypothetical protein
VSDSSIPCGACGAANPVDSTVCVRCGALLAAYQTGTGSASPVEEPSEPASPPPARPEAPEGEPTGTADAIFGEQTIELKPIVVEPFAFDPEAGDPVVEDDFPRPDDEPIDAEFREKPRAAAPPPKPEPERPRVTATTALSRSDEPESDLPADRNVIGTGPLPVKVIFWQVGRTPGCLLGAAFLLLVIACPLLIVAGGRQSDVLAVISFCAAFIAVLGIVGALFVWVRRKLAR